MMILCWSFWRSTWEVWIYNQFLSFILPSKCIRFRFLDYLWFHLPLENGKKIKTLWIAKEGKFIERLAFFWAISSNMIGKIPHVRQYTWSTVHLVENCRTTGLSNSWAVTCSTGQLLENFLFDDHLLDCSAIRHSLVRHSIVEQVSVEQSSSWTRCSTLTC